MEDVVIYIIRRFALIIEGWELPGKLVDKAMNELSALGINKAALVVFDRNSAGNAFWETQGFTVRDDLIYRNKALTEIVRIDT